MIFKSKRDIKYIVIHCTATKEGYSFDSKDINRWHKGLGWSEIGYNYVIKLDGTLELGRNVDKVPSHVKGYNSNSIGVVYVGGLDENMKSKDTRNNLQKIELIRLLKKLKALYPNAKILGHRDFKGVKKDCPCFDAKKEYSNL
jgi:N-acetylmuramoyl-L-alanine amidase